jgi:hypothetical protein
MICTLDAKRARKRRELYDSQDAIDAQRNDLIGKLEGQLKQRVTSTPLFLIAWRLS